MYRIVLSIVYVRLLADMDFHRGLGRNIGNLLMIGGVEYDAHKITSQRNMETTEYALLAHDKLATHGLTWEALKQGWTVQLFTI